MCTLTPFLAGPRVMPVLVVSTPPPMQVPFCEARYWPTSLPPQLTSPSLPEGQRKPKLPGVTAPPPPWNTALTCRPLRKFVSACSVGSVLPAGSVGLHIHSGGVLQ